MRQRRCRKAETEENCCHCHGLDDGDNDGVDEDIDEDIDDDDDTCDHGEGEP